MLLFSAGEPHIHSLCHYLPLEWLNKTRQWPPGDYLLPIGKRGLQLPTTDGSTQRTSFSCPIGFERVVHEYEMFDEEFGEGGLEMVDLGTQVTLHFCKRISIDNDANDVSKATQKRSVWPKGDYCVIVMGATCPPEMCEFLRNSKSQSFFSVASPTAFPHYCRILF